MAQSARGQTWFFHAGVYSTALQATPGDVALLDVRCPRCGAEYITTIDRRTPEDTDSAARAYPETAPALAAAAEVLARECPDHPHRFAVRGG